MTLYTEQQRPIRLDPDASYLENAYHLARLARAAYPVNLHESHALRQAHSAEVAAREERFSLHIPIEHDRASGYVAANGEHIVVAFRGTREFDEWKNPVQPGWTTYHGMRAHKAFAQGVDGVWDALLAALYDADFEEKHLWLTGHSLGGALVTLAAWRLHDAGIEPELTCTFGAPPLCDAETAEAYPARLYRFTNDGDWIPHFRWPSLETQYCHPGEEVRLLRGGRIDSGRYPAHLARRIDRFLNIEDPLPHGGPFIDHHMGEYIRRLGLALEGGA